MAIRFIIQSNIPTQRPPRRHESIERLRPGLGIAIGGRLRARAAQAGGWRLFVPVTVRREQDVLVLARGVAAGEVLTAALAPLSWNVIRLGKAGK